MSNNDVVAMATQFAQCDDDILVWAEEAANRNFKDRLDAWSAISAQVNTLLTLHLAGIGGALAFTVQCLITAGNHRVFGVAAATSCFYLMLLAWALMCLCILSTETPTQGNEPKNLLVPAETLKRVRPGELATLQRRISWQAMLNGQRAKRLDTLRLLTAGKPIVFLAAATATAMG